jgi:hypothetical protein
MELYKPGESADIDLSSGVPKRRYESPRILYREPLEAMAAVCSPAPPAKGNVAFCSQGPISS